MLAMCILDREANRVYLLRLAQRDRDRLTLVDPLGAQLRFLSITANFNLTKTC